MRITPVQLAKRVEAWQYKLVELGIAHWRILAVTLADEMPDDRKADATVKVSTHYDSYQIFFNNDFLENADETRLDETIVHELLHVTMRDLDEALEAAEDWMTPAGYNDWAGTVNHAREGHVDRLSRLIVRLCSGEKPRFSP